jgi:hypothetical protein
MVLLLKEMSFLGNVLISIDEKLEGVPDGERIH